MITSFDICTSTNVWFFKSARANIELFNHKHLKLMLKMYIFLTIKVSYFYILQE